MNILLTGSAGFIGTNLTDLLLRQGHDVVGVDNYMSGQRRNTERLLNHDNFRFIHADVSQAIPYRGPSLDWVLHFASPASPPHYQEHPIETLMVGAQGTQHALELARQHGARFLLASTSEVYGDPDVHPQPETYWGNVNPCGVRSCYDESKRYAEAMTMAYRRTYGLDTRIIRIFNTYGPYMRADDGRVVTNFINQALQGRSLTVYGDGSQTRSFQFVDDLVRGVLKLMSITHHEPVNLGNPDEYTIRDFAEIIRDKIDPSLEIHYHPLPENDPKRRKPDIAVARKLLGWEPQVALHEGLERTIEYFKAEAVTAMQPKRRQRSPLVQEAKAG
jgi:nucleoside-diphosphate-sugar epimerase